MVVMKAMGMTSDQEVVQMVGRDPRYGALLMPSIEVNTDKLKNLKFSNSFSFIMRRTKLLLQEEK